MNKIYNFGVWENQARRLDQKKYFSLLCSLFIILLFTGTVYAQQQITVAGQVTDENGDPLPGTTVVIEGTDTGTTTDMDGVYEIDVARDAVLVFSFVGYQSQRISVEERGRIDVQLTIAIGDLDELIVVGYGERSRATVTSSLDAVQSERINEVPTGSVTSALQGKLAGVRISTISGQPGTEAQVRIRGGSSINKSNDPLYIVDGFPRPINDINTRDIESITVLKDASATAIYGARASNGVILVSTKQGRPGTTEINFNYGLGFQEFPRKVDVLDAEQFLQIMRPAVQKSSYKDGIWFSGERSTATGNDETSTWTTRFLEDGESVPEGWKSMKDPVTGGTLVFQDNNWQDKLFRRALQSNYNLSVSGGNESIRYYGNVGYWDQEGVAIGTNYDRLSARANIDFTVNNRININTLVDLSSSNTNQLENEANVFSRGAFNAPTVREYFDDGTPGWGVNGGLANPEWVTYTRSTDRSTNRTTFGINGDWEITDNLYFSPSANYYKMNYSRDYFEREHQFSSQREAIANRDSQERWQYELLLTYDLSISEEQDVSILGGFSNLYLKDNNVTAGAFGASTDKIPTLNVAPQLSQAFSFISEERLISTFGRLSYNYADKYLIDGNIRRDGSSKFGSDQRYGVFPSVSVGWIVSEESFMVGINNVISRLKIRGSFGLTGNNNIGRYDWQGNYNATYQYAGNAGIRSTDMPNTSLGWESTTQFDVGFDLGLFDNEKVQIVFDYYRKVSNDLLFSLQLPRETGYNSVETNIGSVEFRGYDLVISTDIINKRDFSWSSDFNIAYNTNEVLELPDRPGIDKNRINGIIFPDGTGVGGIAEGEKMGSIVGWRIDYIIDNEQQANNAHFDEQANGYDPEDGSSVLGRKFPGDVEWIDRDGDGRITEFDQFVMGYAEPHTTGGLNNNFRYKKFELKVFVDFALGHSISDQARAWWNGVGARDLSPTTDILDAWEKPGDADKTDQPRIFFHDPLGQRNHFRPNDNYTYKADYMSLRELKLTYNFPQKWLNKIGARRLSMSIEGNNLFYVTKYPGFSPERGGQIAHNTGAYPTFRTFFFNVNFGL